MLEMRGERSVERGGAASARGHRREPL